MLLGLCVVLGVLGMLGWGCFFRSCYTIRKILEQRQQGRQGTQGAQRQQAKQAPATGAGAGFPTELSEWDKKTMAYHEAGHAVVSYFSPEREPLLKITVNPSEEGFGYVKTAPQRDHNQTRVELISAMAVALAGHAAEELLLHETTTSGLYDFGLATQIARDMVTRFGMGPHVGLRQCANGPNSAFLESQIDRDVHDLLEEARRQTNQILEQKRELVERLAEKLRTCGTLQNEEIARFFEQSDEERD